MPSSNFWGGQITDPIKNTKSINTYNINEIEYKFQIKFNTLINGYSRWRNLNF